VRRARNRRSVHVRLQPPHQLILVALAAGAIGKLIAIRAAIIPAPMNGRLPTVPLLASE
jgi:hypothetical protein